MFLSDSLLNWHKHLIALRRSNPALHGGGIVMLNKDNKDVLSYVRTAPKGSPSVVVAANMSAQPRRVSIDLKATGIKGSRVADQVAKSRWLRIQSVNHVFALTLTLRLSLERRRFHRL